MKRIALLLTVAAMVVASGVANAQSCKKKNKKCKKAKTCCAAVADSKMTFNSTTDSVIYIIGGDIGANLKSSLDTINFDLLTKALKLGIEGNDTLLTDGEKQTIMMTFQRNLKMKEDEQRLKDAALNAEKVTEFLTENKKKEGVMETESGLQYKVLTEGSGKSPLATDQVTVHYAGTLLDGTQFDSSYDRGQPATFPLNGVIKGWTEGLQLMKEGATYEFYIKPDLGYGENGSGRIPANSILIFKVELISIGG